VDYQKQNYVAPATLLAVGGRITHREVVAAIGKYARKFARGARPCCAPAVSTQIKPALCLMTKKTEQTQIALGLRACSRHDERRYALRLLNAILGENMSSRLFQCVREEHGLAYSIYSANSFFDDAGDIVIAAGLDLDNLEKTLKLILREMKRLTAQLVPASELRRARDYLIGQLDLSLENSENQMMWAGEQWLGYGKIIHPDEFKKRLGAVTAWQVRASARDFFQPNRTNLALISPLKSAAGLEKILAT
jgi:predicted Zn-dependent peptidase